MPRDQLYDWRLIEASRRLVVHMESIDAGRRVFDATLSLERREISGRALAGVLVRYPLLTAKGVGAIYWNALRLWMKRVPVFTPPARVAGGKRKETAT